MRKQTKLVAVLSAAALLAIGASMTSFAAQGWAEEDGTWVYYDKEGYKVTDEWQKSGSNWFYLNSDGEMTTDEIINDEDNYYYVDVNGAMASNKWVSIENEDSYDDDAPAAHWYYFQANGKAYKAPSSGKTSFKVINGKKYSFDEEGKMLYGWVNETSGRETGDSAWTQGTYFCGDENDGAMATNWAQIAVIDDSKDDEDQTYYFYFDLSTGKKAVDKKDKTINGKKYTFDEDGVMQSKWYSTPNNASTISNYKYYSDPEQGWRAKGWIKVVPAENVNKDAYDDDSAKYFYAESDGGLVEAKLQTVSGKKYAFNNKGEMLSGVQVLVMSGSTITGSAKIDDADKVDASKDGSLEITMYDGTKTKLANLSTSAKIYYFGDGEDGSMKTGNQNVTIDGDNYAYSFGKSGTTKGQGLTGVKDKVLYVAGLRIKADSDMRYQAFLIATGASVEGKDAVAAGDTAVLVNTSGAVQMSKKNLKDTDDMYYCTDAQGNVTGYNATKCGSKPEGSTTVYTCTNTAHK